MTVIDRKGDIFTTTLPAIGHGVNTHGVMGAGIAKDVRRRFPDVYDLYKEECRAGRLRGGGVLPIYSIEEQWIFNLATQVAPGANATYELIRESLKRGFRFIESTGIEGIALPRIGSGIGGLEWDKVDAIIREEAEKYPTVKVEIWEKA